MQHFSQNIALFTAPALKNSRKLFQEYGLYIFSDSSESGFKEEVVSQATHIGLGEKYLCQGDEGSLGKYVKISLIGEILERGNFEIDFEGEKVTKIFHNPSKNLSDKTLLDFMQKFLEESIFYKENGELKFGTQKKWRYIFVSPENIISLSENILYPSKSVVSFVLNVNEKNHYIHSDALIKTVQFNERFRIDAQRCVLIDTQSFEEIKIGNYNQEYTDILVNLLKFPNGYVLEKYNNLKEGLKINYKKLQDFEKTFNEAKFSQILGIQIHISTAGKISRKQ